MENQQRSPSAHLKSNTPLNLDNAKSKLALYYKRNGFSHPKYRTTSHILSGNHTEHTTVLFLPYRNPYASSRDNHEETSSIMGASFSTKDGIKIPRVETMRIEIRTKASQKKASTKATAHKACEWIINNLGEDALM